MTTEQLVEEYAEASAIRELRSGGIRRECKIDAYILYKNRECACTIQNMSKTGLGLQTNCILQFSLGNRLHIRSETFGHIDAVVRWSSHPRYGLEFDEVNKAKKALQHFVDQL